MLRGEWLRDGALVCAIGANHPRARELDAQVIERASFVCCDSIEDAKLESGDLIDPIAAGQLDWLEVHELHEVVAGEVTGRQSDADIVLFKSNGIAAWDVAIGHELLTRARKRGAGTRALAARAETGTEGDRAPCPSPRRGAVARDLAAGRDAPGHEQPVEASQRR